MPMLGSLTLQPIQRDGTLPSPTVALPDIARQVTRATAALYEDAGFEAPWIGYLAMIDDRFVGTCGFKSPPQTDRVEIAYFTFPEYQGRGIATAMASALVALAQEHNTAIRLTAQTLPERNASHRILEKLGFRHVDTIQHPEDGTVWEWHHVPPGRPRTTG